MISTDDTSKETARRAYELGRLRLGIRSAAPVLAMVALALWAGQERVSALLAGLALAVLAAYCRWRGQVWGRAVTPGFVAGSVPLALPLLLRTSGHCCIGGSCWSVCLIGCVLGGVCAGVGIGVASARERQQRWAFLISASSLAGLAGVLGCAIVGAAGVVGMAIAVVVSSLPVAALARPRTA